MLAECRQFEYQFLSVPGITVPNGKGPDKLPGPKPQRIWSADPSVCLEAVQPTHRLNDDASPDPILSNL